MPVSACASPKFRSQPPPSPHPPSKNPGYAYVQVKLKYKLVTGTYPEEKIWWYYAVGYREEHQF